MKVKIYTLVNHTIYDFESEIHIDNFSDFASAKKAFDAAVEAEKKNWDLDDRYICHERGPRYFEVYEDGSAAQNSATIYIAEREVEVKVPAPKTTITIIV